MKLKREYVYIVNLVNDARYMCKFTTDIYKDCVDSDSITYDQFRYALRKQNFSRLDNIISIEQHVLNDYLAPYFETAPAGKRITYPNDDIKLTIFIKNKIFSNVKKMIENN